MLKGISLLSLTLIVSLLILNGCGDKAVTPPNDDPLAELKERINKSPRADTEAELMALWVSHQITAPDSLYDKFKAALEQLRARLSYEHPELNDIHFMHYYGNRQITVWINEEYDDDITNGTYSDLDSLNDLYRGEILSTFHFGDASSAITIRFAGFLDTDHLALEYTRRPSVRYASNGSYTGDYPNIYPYTASDGTPTFLVREAWGDCQAGCAYSHFWYYRVHGDAVEFVGDWNQQETAAPPSWWNEGSIAFYIYMLIFDELL